MSLVCTYCYYSGIQSFSELFDKSHCKSYCNGQIVLEQPVYFREIMLQ